MNWIDEISVKLKKKNQVLFSKNSEYMQDLIMLFETQSHRVMALWAFEFAFCMPRAPGATWTLFPHIHGAG